MSTPNRYRIEIAGECKTYLEVLAKRMGLGSMSQACELAIISLYEQMAEKEFAKVHDFLPITTRLDRIESMLEEVLPEI